MFILDKSYYFKCFLIYVKELHKYIKMSKLDVHLLGAHYSFKMLFFLHQKQHFLLFQDKFVKLKIREMKYYKWTARSILKSYYLLASGIDLKKLRVWFRNGLFTFME